jgi:hypothetical protein
VLPQAIREPGEQVTGLALRKYTWNWSRIDIIQTVLADKKISNVSR